MYLHSRRFRVDHSVLLINYFWYVYNPWTMDYSTCCCVFFACVCCVLVISLWVLCVFVYYLSVSVRPTACVYVWINGYSSNYLWPSYSGSTTHYRGLLLISDTTSGAASRIHLEWTNRRTCGIVEETFNDFNFCWQQVCDLINIFFLTGFELPGCYYFSD